MKQRSQEKELMDLGPAFYTPEEYADCLKILFKVSRVFGFFNHTVRLLRRFPANASLVDVGCGGGLFLLNLSKYYPQMNLRGIDVSETAIALAHNELQRWKKKKAGIKLDFELQRHMALELPKLSVDLVLTTLVCHHIDQDDLIIFLQTAYHAARKAVIINDLHRHALAYWFYKHLSPWLFRNRLITHDGLVSIQRSFTRMEWHAILRQANINNYRIKWCFPFRWSVILWKE